MTSVMRVIRAAQLAGLLALALAAAGCANKPTDPALAGAGNAPPGSQQDFVVNVGDRVFFESDLTELTSQSISTLERQAQWLQNYNQYTFTIEGHADERGTREYNIALSDRRAHTVRDYLIRGESRHSACAPWRMARSARSRYATTFRAGRRTGALSRCSIPALSRGTCGGKGTTGAQGAPVVFLGLAAACRPARIQPS